MSLRFILLLKCEGELIKEKQKEKIILEQVGEWVLWKVVSYEKKSRW